MRKEKRLVTPVSERRDELVGVLTAISIVSKRLAGKLALFEQLPDMERGDVGNDAEAAVSKNAD